MKSSRLSFLAHRELASRCVHNQKRVGANPLDETITSGLPVFHSGRGPARPILSCRKPSEQDGRMTNSTAVARSVLIEPESSDPPAKV